VLLFRRFQAIGVLRSAGYLLRRRVLQPGRNLLHDDRTKPLQVLLRGGSDMQTFRRQHVPINVGMVSGEAAVATAMTAGRWRLGLAVVLTVLAMVMQLSSDVIAQDGAVRTLTILAARCPAGYAGDASADECDGSPMADVTFRVGRPYTDFVITGRTDIEGLVVFEIADLPFRGTIRIIEELPAGTDRTLASCVDDAGTPITVSDEPFPDHEPPIAAALVTVGDTGDIRCDWYNIPASDEPPRAGDPTPTPASIT
jgi:hypothetical protein